MRTVKILFTDIHTPEYHDKNPFREGFEWGKKVVLPPAVPRSRYRKSSSANICTAWRNRRHHLRLFSGFPGFAASSIAVATPLTH